jgi:hypothetical protein
MATLSLPLAAKAALRGLASSFAPTGSGAFETLIAWPLVSRRASIAIGTVWLFCTTRPV